MLTRKQHQLLQFLHQHLKQEGVSPSFDEMKDALGLKSKSGIHRLIIGLEERGFIRRLPHRARAIEILRLPEETAGPNRKPAGASGSGDSPRDAFRPGVVARGPKPVITSAAAGLSEPRRNNSEQLIELPLYGRIAAGTPIEALRDESVLIQVPRDLLGKGDHYALEVEGDSMIEAGIHEGDTVIIKRAEEAENGAIVVAVVGGVEVTLKRLRRRNGAVALEPANKSYRTRVLPPDQVRVQGRLVALLRRY